ncbi:hypothetical protein MLD38_029176 [Melastoma candidum]|uniref:Uncharacterized protein n=1 Tax=Melastoma candidum TaxID=119954 RepID=A0ACB9N2Z7_9MYRT|nr:hypothetical protein MLD38_029176 [Melastoma candidum]
MILSLCMQLILSIAAPLRQKTSNRFVIFLVWSSYLMADWFPFGPPGGPDTITAFSLEDNALWLRRLVGLVAQLSVFQYIFIKTLPNNRLLVPTVLMFVAGVINYGERTRALL